MGDWKMRRFIVLFSVLVAVMVLTGCADGENANNGNAQEDVDVDSSRNEGVSSNEGANDSENEADEGEEEAELTVEEAHEIVFDHFLARLVEIDELMDDVFERENYSKIYDNRTEEFAAFEKEVAEVFQPIITQDSLQAIAEYYAEMYTCECNSYPKITPNMANVNFDLLEQDAEKFVVSFNELEDEMNQIPGQYIMTFALEDGVWKYADAEFKEHTDEAYGLTVEDVANYGFDYQTYEVAPLEYIDTRTIDGKEVLVFEEYGYLVGYEVDTGAKVYIEE